MTSRSRPSITSAPGASRPGPISLIRSSSIRMSPVNGSVPRSGSTLMIVAPLISIDNVLASSQLTELTV